MGEARPAGDYNVRAQSAGLSQRPSLGQGEFDLERRRRCRGNQMAGAVRAR